MAPPTPDEPRQALHGALSQADEGLSFCIVAFPWATFGGALLLGLWGSLPQMRDDPSLAPFWIIILGVCVSFSGWAVLSVRSARRGFTELEMPPLEIQRRIASVWIATAIFMVLIGICALGYLAFTFDPDRMRLITIFGTFDHPLPLTIALTLYFLAGALLLRRSWRERRDAENPPELPAAGGEEADHAAAWNRELQLYAASRSREGVFLFVFATIFLALIISLGNNDDGRVETRRLVILGLSALNSWLSVLMVRRGRRQLEAAGLSEEEVRREMASTWRTGAIMMTIIGAGAIGGVILAYDVLTPANRPWSVGTSLVYTSTGLLLLWRNWQKRDP